MGQYLLVIVIEQMVTLNQPAMVRSDDTEPVVPKHTTKYVTWFVHPPSTRQAPICCTLSGVGDELIVDEQETTGPRRVPVRKIGIGSIDEVFFRLEQGRRRA